MSINNEVKRKLVLNPPTTYLSGTVCPNCRRTDSVYRVEGNVYICTCCFGLRMITELPEGERYKIGNVQF